MTVSDARRFLHSTDPAVRAQAERFLSARAERRRRTAPKRAVGTAEKRAKREERVGRVRDIRAAVLARSGEDCEFCGAPMRLHGFELHHVLSGGARRSEEREDSCAAVCIACHRAWHAGELQPLWDARAWAKRHGFEDALRAIRKRITKIEAAQTPSVPVRIEVKRG